LPNVKHGAHATKQTTQKSLKHHPRAKYRISPNVLALKYYGGRAKSCLTVHLMVTNNEPMKLGTSHTVL
jgi:hypothetical protein